MIKAENIFLAGVIPGSNESLLTAINHFLCPLVDDFLYWGGDEALVEKVLKRAIIDSTAYLS